MAAYLFPALAVGCGESRRPLAGAFGLACRPTSSPLRPSGLGGSQQ